MENARAKMSRGRVLRRITVAGSLLAAAVAGHLAFVEWLAHAIVEAPNHGRRIIAEDAAARDLTEPSVNLRLQVAVGPPPAILSVWILDSSALSPAPQGTVLVLHGIRDRKASMLGMARLLSREGFCAVLVDLRGHGQSSGDWLTYGLVEAHDLAQVIDELERRQLLVGGLGVYGPSYGGAVALQLSAFDPRVRAVVAVATFSSAREAVTDYIRGQRGGWLVPRATIDQALRRADRLTGARLEAARPSKAIAATRAACLVIHGTADTLLSPRNARTLAEAAGGRARLVWVPGANHDTIFADKSGILSRETVEWFRRWLGPSGTSRLSDLHSPKGFRALDNRPSGVIVVP